MQIIRNNYLPLMYKQLWDLFDLDGEANKIQPDYDIIGNKESYEIEFLLSGIKKEDINIKIDENELIINAKRVKSADEKKYKYNNIYFGDYQKIFELPESCDAENISASYENGMLKIVIPKLVDENKATIREIEIA